MGNEVRAIDEAMQTVFSASGSKYPLPPARRPQRPAYSLSALLSDLRRAFHIPDHGAEAFEARLKQYQLRGQLPRNGRGGSRGRWVGYTKDDLWHFAIFLELCELGLSPRNAAAFFEKHKDILMAASYRRANLRINRGGGLRRQSGITLDLVGLQDALKWHGHQCASNARAGE